MGSSKKLPGLFQLRTGYFRERSRLRRSEERRLATIRKGSGVLPAASPISISQKGRHSD
jgi:hypothetical protein